METDSKILVNMIIENCKFSVTAPILIRCIQKLLSLSWVVKITHIWCEGSADWLANFNISIDFYILETLPNELQSLLFNAIFGAWMPKNIHLIC